MVITINKDHCFKWNILTLYSISSYNIEYLLNNFQQAKLYPWLFESNKHKVSKILLIKRKKDCCTKFLMLSNNLTLSLDLINKFRLVFGVGGWEIFF